MMAVALSTILHVIEICFDLEKMLKTPSNQEKWDHLTERAEEAMQIF